MIHSAIHEDSTLSDMNIVVFAQGSYKNNTNVRLDSDVDVCVCLMDTMFVELPAGVTDRDVGLGPSSYCYTEYKDSVEEALARKFGRAGVRRGNKALDIHANTYRVDADVVPAFEHRLYTAVRKWLSWEYTYASGIEIRPDKGGSVVNWPQHHYANGVAKNQATNHRFKFMTRALKRLRNEMDGDGIEAASLPSFLLECLVWNVPDHLLGNESYLTAMRNVLGHVYEATLAPGDWGDWLDPTLTVKAPF